MWASTKPFAWPQFEGTADMAHRLFSDVDEGFSRFYCDTRILACRDTDQARDKIAFILDEVEQATSILFLTDDGVSQTHFFQSLVSTQNNHVIARLGYESAQPPMECAIEQAREHACDAIVAIGGGSVLDSAKLIAATLASNIPLEHLRDTATLPTHPLPLVCVPTTFGTGAEANMYGHLSSEHGKIGLRKTWLAPKYAVLTGAPALELGPAQRYLTGLDAWVHAFEALTLTRERSVFNDTFMQKALDLHHHNFRNFVERPDLKNALAMATASTLAGVGLNNARTGVIHTLAVPFTAHFHIPHAQAILPFIRPALTYNWPMIKHLFGEKELDRTLADLEKTTLFSLDEELQKIELEIQPSDIADMTIMAQEDTVLIKENPQPISSEVLSYLYSKSLKPWIRV
jgi:alcohol dehydrogenase class IV